MNRREREDLLRTAARLGRLGFGLDAIEEFASISRKLHRIDERSCNGYQDGRGDWDEAAEHRAELRACRLWETAKSIVAEAIAAGTVPAGTRCYHQSDPRGAALYVCGPDVAEPIDRHYSNGIAV